MIGHTLAHYKILEKLGAGGMGEVYRAEDTTLKRHIALKVLTPEFAADPERLERFQREAETLATLEHPNIVTIHTVETATLRRSASAPADAELGFGEETVHFLTMELVKGRRLSELIPRTGMPLERILEVTATLATALAAAHETGVVHRDLKPANIMVTEEGRVKILDFGLAKLRRDAKGELVSELPTEPLTEEGRLLGTTPYMSPEQLEGKALDSRSDIFSFGIILYEMAAGSRPFQGDSSTSIMGRILAAEPQPLGDIRPDLPPEFLRIVRRCLRKRPEDRYNDTRDLAVALEDLREDVSSGVSGQLADVGLSRRPTRRRARGVRLVLFGAAILAAIAVTALLLGRVRGPRASPAVARHQQITFSGKVRIPDISPDGAFIAYAAQEGVVVHDVLGQGKLQVLEAEPSELGTLAWSPDGSKLLVSGRFSGEWTAAVIPRLGGGKQTLKPYPYMCWSPDGSRVAGAWQNLKEIFLQDLESREVSDTFKLEGAFRWLHGIDWSPVTNLLLATTVDDENRHGIWIASSDGRLQTEVLQTEEPILSARWSRSEPAIYFYRPADQGTELWKIAVAAQSGEPRGSARPILTGLQAGPRFSVSRDGMRLAYTRTASFSTLWGVELNDSTGGRQARKTELVSGTQSVLSFSTSPAGDQVAFSRGTQESSDLFLLSVNDRSVRQLTFLKGRNVSPVWSPDGRTIAFGSTHDGTPRVWRMSAEGGTPQVLETGDVSISLMLSWAPGERLLYHKPGNRMFHLLNVETGAEQPLLGDEMGDWGWYFAPVYSPDGRRAALYANLGGAEALTVTVGDPWRPPTTLARESGRSYGRLSQRLDAHALRGRAIRLSAKVRVSGEGDIGHLWLRVDREGGATGFYDRMTERPVKSVDWGEFRIVGKVDDDATEVVFGCVFLGSGAMWVDEFRLSVRNENGDWEELPIENAGFDEISESGAPIGWQRQPSSAIAYFVTSEAPALWGPALKVEARRKPAAGTFFPVGWSSDGRFVYLIKESGETIIYRIPAEGGMLEPFIDLELDEKLEWVSFAADGRHLVAAAVKEQSDVWIVESFDPE